jgi:hypothetical protein
LRVSRRDFSACFWIFFLAADKCIWCVYKPRLEFSLTVVVVPLTCLRSFPRAAWYSWIQFPLHGVSNPTRKTGSVVQLHNEIAINTYLVFSHILFFLNGIMLSHSWQRGNPSSQSQVFATMGCLGKLGRQRRSGRKFACPIKSTRNAEMAAKF